MGKIGNTVIGIMGGNRSWDKFVDIHINVWIVWLQHWIFGEGNEKMKQCFI